MNTISKPVFDEMLANWECNELFHPWSSNCFEGSLKMIFGCIKGSIIFFSIMYSIPIILKTKRKTKYSDTLKQFVRSVILGVIQGSGCSYFNCIFRNLISKSHYYTVGFLTGFLSSCSIAIDHPERRPTVTTAFLTMAIEGILKRLVQSGYIFRSRKWEMLLFMICNSLLMSRIQSRLQRNIKTVWFFIPPKIKQNESGSINSCSHDGHCSYEILRDLIKYTGTGIIITLIKMAIYNTEKLKTPIEFLRLCKLKNFKLTIFISAYVGLYKVMDCLTAKINIMSSFERSLFSSLISGCSYWINPSYTLMATIITILFKSIIDDMKREKTIPDWPYEDIIYPVCSGFLVHLYCMHPVSCPMFFKFMANLITRNRFKNIIDNIHSKLEKHNKTS